MNPDELLMQIYNDMLDVMASGRPTGSTERLANELRAYLGQPEWPTLETSKALDPPYEDFGHSIDCAVDGKPPNKKCTCGAEARARSALNTKTAPEQPVIQARFCDYKGELVRRSDGAMVCPECGNGP